MDEGGGGGRVGVNLDTGAHLCFVILMLLSLSRDRPYRQQLILITCDDQRAFSEFANLLVGPVIASFCTVLELLPRSFTHF